MNSLEGPVPPTGTQLVPFDGSTGSTGPADPAADPAADPDLPTRRRGPFVRHTRRDVPPKKPLKTRKKLDTAKRRIAARILSGPGELPLDILLERARYLVLEARKTEREMAELGGGTADQRATAMMYSDAAIDAATRAAPFLHARLAPIVPKGEQGMIVNLVIEDV